MFESRTSAGAKENLPETKAMEKPDTETISSWSYDMEGHAEEMCGKVLRTGEYNDSTIIQSRDTMHG